MTMVRARIDRIEEKFTDLGNRISCLGTQAQQLPVTSVATVPSAPASADNGLDPAFKIPLAVETERLSGRNEHVTLLYRVYLSVKTQTKLTSSWCSAMKT